MNHKRNLRKEAKGILDNLGQGGISPSVYDTAWVARIPDSKNPKKPMFPRALNWIVSNQYPNGSWGGKIEYYHDRIICALSAIVALNKYNDSKKYQREIEKGEKYINSNIKNLKKDNYLTVSFELLFPALLKEAKGKKLNLLYNDSVVKKYLKIKNEKLKLLPENLIYKKLTTLSHSVEFLGNDLNKKEIIKVQNSNGSFLNSPSATVYVYLKTGDQKSLEYIKEIMKKFNDAAPVNYPIDIFEICWVLDSLYSMELESSFTKEIKRKIIFLKKHWGYRGMGWSTCIPLADLDDTAIALGLFRKNGMKISPDVFENFITDGKIKCFDGEFNPSPSHIIHLYDALKECEESDFVEDLKKSCLNHITKMRNAKGYWYDKWHISPYYTTSHAIFAFGVENEISKKAIDWIIKTQRRDGSWGFFEKGTCEETAYCLQVLLLCYEKNKKIKKQSLEKAAGYLNDNFESYDYPEMWIEKCLYTPFDIVRFYIILSLIKYDEVN
ncbi:MAG: hypothetical protein KAQ87_01285 [Candidatus Pacebacteria bacterium]|nr:hypothetical protein [Candidatus Paceibacterota bacterium]